MRAVIGVLRVLAEGQRRGHREIEKLVVGGGDPADHAEVGIEALGQAEGGDPPGRFRRQIGDGARHRKFLAELDVGLGALGMDVVGRQLRFDRHRRVVIMPLAADLEPRAEILVVIAMVRRVAAQGADREIERVKRQIGRQDRGRRLAGADKIGDFDRRGRPDEFGAPDVDDDQARRKPALPQVIGIEEVFARLAVRNRHVEAAVALGFVLRQQGGPRGAEDHAIVIVHARQKADQLRQPLIEGIIDLGQDVAAQIPQWVN